MFYHDIKEHMSPSALAQWLNGRGQFVRSYFAKEKSPETKAMTGGTEIHALVEAGIIKAKKVFAFNEDDVRVQVPGTNFFFFGKPDSYSKVVKDSASFVDYKSGKANAWAEKLPTDIKMRATAWLVWIKLGCPAIIKGFIEYIPTTWDPNLKKVVPIEGQEHEVVEIVYTAKELEAFTKVIVKAMNDVNDFFEKWKESTGDFVNVSDVKRFVELRQEIEKLQAEEDEVGDRILNQMEFGGEENHKTGMGTFFVSRKKTYEYPKDLAFLVMGEKPFTIQEAELVAAGAKAAKANFELANDPKEVKTSISFRKTKDK